MASGILIRVGNGKPETDADMSETLQKDGCGDTIPPQYIIGTC